MLQIKIVCPGMMVPVRTEPSVKAEVKRYLRDGDDFFAYPQKVSFFYKLADDSGYVNASTKEVQWVIEGELALPSPRSSINLSKTSPSLDARYQPSIDYLPSPSYNEVDELSLATQKLMPTTKEVDKIPVLPVEPTSNNRSKIQNSSTVSKHSVENTLKSNSLSTLNVYRKAQNVEVFTTENKINLWVNTRCKLTKVDPAEQTFNVDGWLNFFWLNPNKDISEGSLESGFIIEDDGKNIPINIENMFDNVIECEVVAGPHYHYNASNGCITMTIRYKGEFSEAFELERFPYDRQYLTTRLCIRTRDYHILSIAPDFVPDKHGFRTLVSCTTSPSVDNWETYTPVVSKCEAIGHDRGHQESMTHPRMTISLRIERKPNYYIWNIVFPIFMIVSCAPVAFALNRSDIGGRMGIILALLLTLVTFKFIIAGDIPKSSVITLIDKYIITSYSYVIAAVVQTLASEHLVSESLSSRFDYLSTQIFMGSWIALHVWILSQTATRSFCTPWPKMKDRDSNVANEILPCDIHL